MARRQRRSTEDFAEEIEAHLALEADRLVQEGLSPEEARLAAARRFGNVVRVQERFYESGRWLWKDQLLQDLRGAVRAMAKYPVGCVVAVISLAAGIGAATITLTLRDTLFYNTPPSYRDADRLSHASVATPTQTRGSATVGLFRSWASLPPDVADVAGAGRAAFKDVTLPDRVETMPVRPATRNLFSVLGVRPLLGRGFDEQPADASTGAMPPAMLSFRHWQQLFGGRSDAVGTTILVDGAPHVIVGVMPAGFWFVSDQPPLWTLLDVPRLGRETPIDVVARRGPDTSSAMLQDRLQTLSAEYIESRPAEQREMRVQAIGVGGTPIGNNVGPMPVLLVVIAVVLTLVIACTNVAILMIAQWTAREHEIAIRASLGGSRGRLVRALVTESTTIAVLGGVLGVLLTLALRGLLARSDHDGEIFYDLSIKPDVFGAVAAITMLAGLLTGLAPALYETRRLQLNPLQLLRTNDRVRQRWRHALVGFEIAVTVALLVVTGAVLSAYDRTTTSDLGFDTHRLFVLRLEHPDGVATRDTLNHLRGYPGIAAVAVATAVPITAPGPQRRVAAAEGASVTMSAEAVTVGDGFFEALGVPLTSGRDFTPAEHATASRAVVVNDLLAAQLWPGRDAGGEMLRIEDVPHEVVGVVRGYANFALRPVKPMFFLPLAEDATGATRVQFLLRAAGDPGALTDPIRRETRDLRQGNAVTRVTTLDQILDVGGQETLILVYPLAPLIATGLLLTAAGIYGVLAFAVARRSNELAVRIAVGASRGRLARLMLAHTLRLVAVGLVCGVGATFAVTRIAQGSGGIFDSPGWRAFLVPIAIVATVGALATWVPSRRAMRVDPATLLRAT